MASGGRISTQGSRGGRMLDVNIRIEGLDRTSDEFKQARREFNNRIRDVMVKVGTHEVLPTLRSELPHAFAGKDTGMFVQRERSGVFVGSKLRGSLNRALGWWDFGGSRPGDHFVRTGPHVIVRTLDAKRDRIDDAVLRGLMDAFDPLDHTP